ncbi:MAG: endonuclease NucS [Candidatus Diapherotrites archaeon]|nr:endonuclease NucS [Candidatus Diapherotrites archaeon]
MDSGRATGLIRDGLSKRHLVTVFGECSVDYLGRATSNLPFGKRLAMIKGDGSVSIHQNRLVRPTNYMVNTRLSIEESGENAVLVAKKLNPREQLTITFRKIMDVKSYPMEITNDLRLSGSERDLNDLLMDDLSMIEPGLKPVNQQEHFSKGIADIIAEDSAGNFVVIELKRRQADYASVTQLHRYMRQVEKLKNRKTRGILLAPDIRSNAKKLLHELGLEFARLDFELKPSSLQKAEIKGLERKQTTLGHFGTGK